MSTTTQLIEKRVTITNPVDGSPLTVEIAMEVRMPDCTCEPRIASPGNPSGWQPASRRS